MKLLTRRTIIRTALMLTTALGVVLIPATASASKVHIDVPGISIGFHGYGHHDRHYKRHYKKRYHNRHYRNGYRYRNRNYYGYRNYYPNSRRYYDNYYRPRSNYYKRNYRTEICPIAGYSPYYNDNLNCYRHKDHFHCS